MHVSIPTPPVVLARLLVLYADEGHSTAELVRVLEGDPGIASRLLRLANSAYYGFQHQVSSVDRAILVVGRTTVQAVALAATLLRAWEGRPLPRCVEDLWLHAYLCGLGCRYMALRLPGSRFRSEANALFLTGLLHDLGKILFLVRSPDEYAEDLGAAASRAELLSREKQRFGQDHAQAGGEALESWQFPPRMSAAVRYHHDQGLRMELRADWEVLTTVDGVLRGLPDEASQAGLPPLLLSDLSEYLRNSREEAEAFYRAVA